MGDRDAFGRKPGEDTLSEMGWTLSGAEDAPRAEAVAVPQRPAVAASASPAAAPELPVVLASAPSAAAPEPPAVVAAATSAPSRPRPRGRRRGRVRTVVTLVAIGGVGLSTFASSSLVERGTDALDELQSTVREATESIEAAAPTAAAPTDTAAPTGTEAGSLLRPAALREALAKLPEGALVNLRVAPDRVDAQVMVDGKLHQVQVTAAGDVQDIGTQATIPAAADLRVNAAAPNRIARTAARRAGRSVASVSYLVLLDFAGEPRWSLFFDDGLHYSANASGTKVRRVG